MTHLLSNGDGFNKFSLLYMNEKGNYIQPDKDLRNFSDAQEIQLNELPEFFRRYIVLRPEVTDVFVWVHGWRNTAENAIASSRRLFKGIQEGWNQRKTSYPQLNNFNPAFVAVHWPSMSRPNPVGYKKIRDRAKALTDEGEAEFFLASLLGYLETNNVRSGSKVLRAKGGFAVHCLGHSFGGRFLTVAIRAAATPQSPRTLSLLTNSDSGKLLSAFSNNGFEFTVDSALIFQMAAPHSRFANELHDLVNKAPLSGPLVLTHSIYDTANCLWHSLAECEAAIGYSGASEPKADIGRITLGDLNYVYTNQDFSTKIVNVDASWAFLKSGVGQGAHSDFWYQESIHLILSLVNFVNAF
jgi:hypothetical protein